MSGKARRRKTKSKKKKDKQIKTPNTKPPQRRKTKQKRKSQPFIPLPMIFRVIIASMFLTAVYVLKRYYLARIPSAPATAPVQSTIDDTDNDVVRDYGEFASIVNTEDIISRFHDLPQEKIPQLKLWKLSQFWTDDMAQYISNTLHNEFMDINTRKSNFYFTFNRGNEKIRSNDNIEENMRIQKHLKKKNAFAYAKYEYRRRLPLYQEILSYLNSSYVAQILSNLLEEEIVGVSDLFVSIYFKDNFLSDHDDRGLGHYAFVNFLSQEWDFDDGGSLHFNCPKFKNYKESCVEPKPEFNDVSIFKVWPLTMLHHVSAVNIYEPRIAITGWFFTKDPKGVFWNQINEETAGFSVGVMVACVLVILYCVAFVAASQWILSSTSTVPMNDYDQAIGRYNNSIFILGGRSFGKQLIEYLIADDAFINHGSNNLGHIMRGYAQYWTQISHILYLLEPYDFAISIFDMKTNAFTSTHINNIPSSGEQYACIASNPTELFVLGGISSYYNPISAVDKYDLLTNRWITSIASMQSIRGDLSCIVHPTSNKLYAIGGAIDKQTYTATIEAIDTNSITQNAWMYIESLSDPLAWTRCVVYEDTIYVIGGADGNMKTGLFYGTNKVHIIDVFTNEVHVSPHRLPTSLSDAAPIIVDHILYIFSGWVSDTDSAIDQWMMYNLRTSSPTTDSPIQQPTVSPAERPTVNPTGSPTHPPTQQATAITTDPTAQLSITSAYPTVIPSAEPIFISSTDIISSMEPSSYSTDASQTTYDLLVVEATLHDSGEISTALDLVSNSNQSTPMAPWTQFMVIIVAAIVVVLIICLLIAACCYVYIPVKKAKQSDADVEFMENIQASTRNIVDVQLAIEATNKARHGYIERVRAESDADIQLGANTQTSTKNIVDVQFAIEATNNARDGYIERVRSESDDIVGVTVEGLEGEMHIANDYGLKQTTCK